MMRRIRHWDIALMEYAMKVRGEPFAWGRTNCAALVAASVDVMTGSGLFAYQQSLNLTEAKARQLSVDRHTRAVLLDAGLCRVVNPVKSQRGDILLCMENGWECSHVVLGRVALSSTPERGVFFALTSEILKHAGELEVLRCPQ